MTGQTGKTKLKFKLDFPGNLCRAALGVFFLLFLSIIFTERGILGSSVVCSCLFVLLSFPQQASLFFLSVECVLSFCILVPFFCAHLVLLILSFWLSSKKTSLVLRLGEREGCTNAWATSAEGCFGNAPKRMQQNNIKEEKDVYKYSATTA